MSRNTNAELIVALQPNDTYRYNGHQVCHNNASIECVHCGEQLHIPELVRQSAPLVEQVYRLYAVSNVTDGVCPSVKELADYTYGTTHDVKTTTISGIDVVRTKDNYELKRNKKNTKIR